MKTCETKIDEQWVEASFYGVFQYSNVIPPSLMVDGHNGGVMAYPIAVIELGGKLAITNINDVRNIKEIVNEY